MTRDAIERRLYPGFQVFGGGFCVFNWLNQVVLDVSFSAKVVLTMLAAVGLASALLAILHLEGNRKVSRWCKYLWLVQIPSFGLPWASYRFFAGGELRFALDLSKLALSYDFQLGMAFVASVDQDGETAYLGVNALAVLAMLYYGRLLSKQQTQCGS